MVAATNLKNGVALSLAMAVILVPTVILSLLLRQKLKFPYWLGTPVWTMAAMLLASLSYYVIRFISVEITDFLGIYLYLLASAAVVSAVFTVSTYWPSRMTVIRSVICFSSSMRWDM